MIGCDVVQGYYTGRPMELAQLTQSLTTAIAARTAPAQLPLPCVSLSPPARCLRHTPVAVLVLASKLILWRFFSIFYIAEFSICTFFVQGEVIVVL